MERRGKIKTEIEFPLFLYLSLCLTPICDCNGHMECMGVSVLSTEMQSISDAIRCPSSMSDILQKFIVYDAAQGRAQQMECAHVRWQPKCLLGDALPFFFFLSPFYLHSASLPGQCPPSFYLCSFAAGEMIRTLLIRFCRFESITNHLPHRGKEGRKWRKNKKKPLIIIGVEYSVSYSVDDSLNRLPFVLIEQFTINFNWSFRRFLALIRCALDGRHGF